MTQILPPKEDIGYKLTNTPGAMPGVDGLVVLGKLKGRDAELNCVEFKVSKTSAVYRFRSCKAWDEIVKLKYHITETFDGTLSIGTTADADAIVANDEMPHSGSGILAIGKLIGGVNTKLLLTVSGNSTGAGTFKLYWEV